MTNITNKVWSLLVCFFVMVSMALAQPPPPPEHEGDFEPPSKEVQQKMKELHHAFIADKLELTDRERKALFPIFNKMQEEKKTMHQGMKKDFKALRKKARKGELTEADANKLLDHKIQMEEKRLAIRKKYLAKMRKVLPATKLVELEHIDRRFKGEVMRRFRGKHKGGKGKRGKRRHHDHDGTPPPPPPHDED